MDNKFFKEIKGKFGFGCMRLPKNGEEVDTEEFKRMVDYFLEAGFNYFDTAHGYISGKSELAIKEGLTSRYPREKYLLTNKLSESFFNCEEDIRPLFEEQLKCCGVDYFDFYLMHAQNRINYEKYKKCNAYNIAAQLKKEGKIRHVGLSFHDTADILDKILSEQKDIIEIVQIQFNYLDYESDSVQSRKCYEVLKKYNKPAIVMEPVKGGSLVNLPSEAKKVFDELNSGSYASYALRFAAQFEMMAMVLSGMSNLEQMKDNISFMKDVKPLDERESEAVKKVVSFILNKDLIPCTGCRYCVDGCPKKILIPELFADLNAKFITDDWNSPYYYEIHTSHNGKASECIKCGKCERICPQKLEIRNLLEKVASTFENGKGE